MNGTTETPAKGGLLSVARAARLGVASFDPCDARVAASATLAACLAAPAPGWRYPIVGASLERSCHDPHGRCP